MGIPIIGDLIEELGKTALQVIPDPAAKREFELKLEEVKDRVAARQHDEAMGQIEINKVEAGHASVFVSGWRPALGWVGAAGASAAFVILPVSEMLQAWFADKPIPDYPTDNLMAMVLYLLGASGIRSFEKLKGTAFSKLGEQPEMARVKEVQSKATPGVADKLPLATHADQTPAPATAPANEEEGAPWVQK